MAANRTFLGSSALSVQLRRERFSIGQYSGAEESKAGAPVHLTLNGFEPIDLAFNLAAAPWGLHRSSNGLNVSLKTIRESD